MRIAALVSQADMHLLPEWVSIHQHLKGIGLNHSLHFITTPSAASAVQEAKGLLDDCFESVHVHEMDSEPFGGWPQASNMQFHAAALAMYRDNKAIPWLLCELDCRPIKATAYDVIAGRYASCGAPFFGNVDKTPWRETNPTLMDNQGNPTTIPNPKFGKITVSPYGDADKMMSGCAVYPGDMMERRDFGSPDGSSGLMADFVKGNSSIDMAWDMHLAPAMRRHGLAHSNLIAQHWNTENYRIEDGRIVCDGRKTHEFFQRNPNYEIRNCGGIVSYEAVMIHGCKDQSLTNLIVNDLIPEYIPPVKTQTAAIGSATVVQPDTRVDALEKQMGQLTAMMQQLLVQKTSPPSPNVTQGEPAEPILSGHETKGGGDSLQILEKVGELVVGKKCMRLSELSKKLKVDASTLEPLIEGSSDFELQRPLKWVKRKAA